MEEVKEKELIVIKQLPIIEEQLQIMSKEIDEKIKKVTSLEVNLDNVKKIKNIRSSLKKELTEFETKRKAVKKAIETPYKQFEAIYKKLISDKYNEADTLLKTRIDEQEDVIKKETESKVISFYENQINNNEFQKYFDYKEIGLKIDLSSSFKSYTDKIKEYIEKIENDIKLIFIDEYKEELLVEYLKDKNYSRSKIEINDRHTKIKELENNSNKIADSIGIQKEIIAKVNEIIAPVEIIEEDTEELSMSFKVFATKQKLKELKKFMEERGIKYE